jgi:hypothetical protein
MRRVSVSSLKLNESVSGSSPLLERWSEILAFDSKFKKLKNMKKFSFKGWDHQCSLSSGILNWGNPFSCQTVCQDFHPQYWAFDMDGPLRTVH